MKNFDFEGLGYSFVGDLDMPSDMRQICSRVGGEAEGLCCRLALEFFPLAGRYRLYVLDGDIPKELRPATVGFGLQ